MTDFIIFDLDGTLVDSAAVCTEILNGMLRDRGSFRDIAVHEAKPYLSRGGAQMVAELLGNECGNPELELAEFRTRYAQFPTPTSSLFAGVHAGLHELASLGFGLAICSNKPQNLCEKVLAELGLASVFSAVVGGSSGRRPKPAPDLMELTLDSLGATAEHCLFVGDSELDHAIAEATGVPFLFVGYGYADAEWDRSGLVEFGHFADLVQVIRAIPRSQQQLRLVA